MTSEQFAYWLQGFAEVHGEPPTKEQWKMIKKHLDTVFFKITSTPSIFDTLKKKEEYTKTYKLGDVVC